MLDREYSYDRFDEGDISIGQRSICHSSHRDASSGGGIYLYQVQKERCINISSENIMIVQRMHVVERNTEDDASDVSKAVTSDSVTA